MITIVESILADLLILIYYF